jgi:4a-hydroxytetrahydrobiopterin dehydratase
MSSASKENSVAASGQKKLKTFNQRFDFGSYGQTRKFLDELADLSKREGYYPDVSFGTIYVNISIDGDGQADLNERKSDFIADMQALASKASD